MFGYKVGVYSPRHNQNDMATERTSPEEASRLPLALRSWDSTQLRPLD